MTQAQLKLRGRLCREPKNHRKEAPRIPRRCKRSKICSRFISRSWLVAGFGELENMDERVAFQAGFKSAVSDIAGDKPKTVSVAGATTTKRLLRRDNAQSSIRAMVLKSRILMFSLQDGIVEEDRVILPSTHIIRDFSDK